MHYTQALAISVTFLFASGSLAIYTLSDNYNASNFFDEFTFFSDADPTNGFVQYQAKNQANSSLLAALTLEPNQQVYLGVDHKTQNPASGRSSVRVSSNKDYTEGLFIADIAHMPTGCGTWPALWTLGGPDTWPADGEIDILEGVNLNTKNSVTLHTSAGCTMDNTGSAPGSIFESTDCNSNSGKEGCSQDTTNTQGFGTGFNKAGGGVYAMQWNSSVIAVWFFPRSAIPDDITATSKGQIPDPSLWGTPMASFSGKGCDITSHFKRHSIIINTTFCGDWAGLDWSNSTCAALAPTCAEYVTQNPDAFADAYWLINKVMVYQESGTGQSAAN